MSVKESLLDRDRLLVLDQAGGTDRVRLESLWQLDAAIGAQLISAREPVVAQIRLAWWRDSLLGLDSGVPPAEPVLQSIASHVLPAGVAGSELARMTDGWELLVGPEAPSSEELAEYASLRGGSLFQLSARLLQTKAKDGIALAGEGWALVDLGRRSTALQERELAFALASNRLGQAMHRWPMRLRSLGMLVALARRDVARGAGKVEPTGVPPRLLRMHWHRLTGY